MELEKRSAGFQIGAEQIDLVLLMMNRQGVDKLLKDKVNIGAFAGIDVSGGSLRPDKSANERTYGASVVPANVLFGRTVAEPASAQAFVHRLSLETRATTGRK